MDKTTNSLELLEILYQAKPLTSNQSEYLFGEVINGCMDEITMSSMLISLKLKGETANEIAGAAIALRKAASFFPKPDYKIIDLVGTGGDGHDTINISSTASIVAAAAGAKVAKHGNRSVSSKSGSSDLFNSLGVNLNMSPNIARKCLDDLGLCFLFAPNYHKGFKHAAAVRQRLKTRTIFNILGPLINPGTPEIMLLGVYKEELIKPIVETLAFLKVKNAMVVHGSGLDEIAIHGPTAVGRLIDDNISYYTLVPDDFGLKTIELSAIKGGTPEQNALYSQAILDGTGPKAHIHAVAANAGAAIYLSELAPSIKDGVNIALETINNGSANKLLQDFAALSHKENSQ